MTWHQAQVMNTQELETNLRHFTGTESYHRLAPRFLITDGVQYLAENAHCYWLLTAIHSHIIEIKPDSQFVVTNLKVADGKGDLVLDDGNGNFIASQHFDYTDFPLPEMKLYCINEGQHWITLLPSEC